MKEKGNVIPIPKDVAPNGSVCGSGWQPGNVPPVAGTGGNAERLILDFQSVYSHEKALGFTMENLVNCLEHWARTQPEQTLFRFLDGRGHEK